MKDIQALRTITYKNKTYRAGQLLQVEDAEAKALIGEGHAKAAIVARETDDPGDDVVEGE